MPILLEELTFLAKVANSADPIVREQAYAAYRRGLRELGKRFNPDQPRGHDGRWIHGADALVSTVFRRGKSSVAIHHHGDGTVTLEDVHGHHARLNADALRQLRHHSIMVAGHEDVGHEAAIHTHEYRPEGLWSNLHGAVRLNSTGEEHPRAQADPDEESWPYARMSLHLPPNDDPSWDDVASTPGTEFESRHLTQLAEQAADHPARRGHLADGQEFATYRDGKERVVRVGTTELRLSLREARKLEDAVASVGDMDGQPESKLGTPDVRTIRTATGDITVTAPFSDQPTPTTIRTPQGQQIVIPAGSFQFSTALSRLAEIY